MHHELQTDTVPLPRQVPIIEGRAAGPPQDKRAPSCIGIPLSNRIILLCSRALPEAKASQSTISLSMYHSHMKRTVRRLIRGCVIVMCSVGQESRLPFWSVQNQSNQCHRHHDIYINSELSHRHSVRSEKSPWTAIAGSHRPVGSLIFSPRSLRSEASSKNDISNKYTVYDDQCENAA